MSVIQGGNGYLYEYQEGWGKLPDGWEYREVPAVAVDRQDHVYLFNRGKHPMIVLDRDGNFLRAWGEDLFVKAHGIHFGPDDCLYCTDEGDHTIKKCSLDGKLLMTIGIPGKPSPYMSGEPFHRCTHTAHSPEGDIYVSNGYGDARVHKYTQDGKLIRSWGESGCEPGQFSVPHNIGCDADGWVYVADRENHRIQIFNGDGKYETQLNNMFRPSGLFLEPGRCPVCFIGETPPGLPVHIKAPHLGGKVRIITHKGELIAKLGLERPGLGAGAFLAPHGLAVNSYGDLYVGEVTAAAWPRLNPGLEPPKNMRCLQKWKRVR